MGRPVNCSMSELLPIKITPTTAMLGRMIFRSDRSVLSMVLMWGIVLKAKERGLSYILRLIESDNLIIKINFETRVSNNKSYLI